MRASDIPPWAAWILALSTDAWLVACPPLVRGMLAAPGLRSLASLPRAAGLEADFRPYFYSAAAWRQEPTSSPRCGYGWRWR